MRTDARVATGRRAARFFCAAAGVAVAAFLVSATSDSAPMAPRAAARDISDSHLIAVAPPPFTPGVFPCSRCHASRVANRQQRALTWAHQEIHLEHDEENRWCLDCHDAENRDKLHLAGGRLLDFTESYRLCGQCHGPSLKNWLAGEHGKRTGSWSGAKQYLLCASCHNPHSPRFKPLQPMPPPVRPENLRHAGDSHVR